MYYRSKRTDKQNIIFLWPLTSNKFNLTFSLALFLFYHCLFTYCTHFSVLRWITSNVNSPTTWWQFLPNRAFKLFSNLYTWCNVQQFANFPNRLQSKASSIRILFSTTTDATDCFSSTSAIDFPIINYSISWTGLFSFPEVKKFGCFYRNSDSKKAPGDITR